MKHLSIAVCCEPVRSEINLRLPAFLLVVTLPENAKSSVIGPPVTSQKEDSACINSWCLI